MEKTPSRISLLIIFAIFAGFFWGAGFLIGKDYRTVAQDVPLKLDKLTQVYKALQEDFIFKDKIELEKLEYGAAKGLIEAVQDPYTYYLDPKESKEFEEIINGSFEGIGAEIGLNENRQIIVIAPLQGTPAKRAGLQPQDIILQINDTVTSGMTLDQAVALIRGPKGSTVTLTVQRLGVSEPLKISIVRDTIEIPILQWKLLEEGEIAYVQLFNFNERAGDAFSEIAQKILTSPAHKIILDVRGNPGGILQEAVEVAGWFIDKDSVVSFERFADDSKRPYKSTGPTKLKGFPLVVLVDKGSASASEILAGALRVHNNALLVGEKTFGKGTVQVLEKFSDGSSLRVTVSQWLLPDGSSIDTQGLVPNVLVARKGVQENAKSGEDEQLKKAIELLVSSE